MSSAPAKNWPRSSSSSSSRPSRRRRPRLLRPRSESAFTRRPASKRRDQNNWANAKSRELQKK
eukprot:12555201-Alexandrium_andersonii.AAC.1